MLETDTQSAQSSMSIFPSMKHCMLSVSLLASVGKTHNGFCLLVGFGYQQANFVYEGFVKQ